MKKLFFSVLSLFLYACSKPILEKKYSNTNFKQDSVKLESELDIRTFSNLMVYLNDFKSTSIDNFTYEQLIRLSDDYSQELSIKEIEEKIQARKKMICSKKWYIKSIQTSGSGEFDIGEHIEGNKDNTIFEKEYKYLEFKEDNTFKQIRKDDPEVEKGKWYVGLKEFNFDGIKYRIDSLTNKKMIATSSENTSYGSFSTNIKQRIVILAIDDNELSK